MKKFLFFIFVIILGLNAACSTASAPNGNSNTANANVPANIPPEFSNRQITPSGNSTPGIPDPSTINMNSLPKGTTPTPGIPHPKDLNKPQKPGATPTPGIPSPEELKKQLNRTLNNANVVNQLPKNQKDLEKTVDDTIKEVRKKP